MLTHIVFSEDQQGIKVISETGSKLFNRLALKSQDETELYSLHVH
jgi:hypothetical protein